MAARVSRAALAWAAVAAVLFAVWMLLVDTREVPQLIAGAVVAAIGATGSELVRRNRSARMRLRAGWVARLPLAAAAVPGDLARLTAQAVRAALPGGPAPSGRLRALEFEPGRTEDGDPGALGRSALALVAGSFSPNTIAIGVDEERRALLVHQLVPDEERPRRSIDPLDLG
ncbi:MAG: Na+/H+ antiporter subunit E [Solirubrobacterales bacterium]